MVDVIKLKDLGFDVDFLTPSDDSHHDKLVHHMLKGYKKFNNDYIHLLSDHATHVLGIEDAEAFRNELLTKAASEEKDDVLHCALGILSIHHRKRHHEINGHGVSFPETHKMVWEFLKSANEEKIQEIHDRFPHVTKEVLSNAMPEYEKSIRTA